MMKLGELRGWGPGESLDVEGARKDIDYSFFSFTMREHMSEECWRKLGRNCFSMQLLINYPSHSDAEFPLVNFDLQNSLHYFLL